MANSHKRAHVRAFLPAGVTLVVALGIWLAFGADRDAPPTSPVESATTRRISSRPTTTSTAPATRAAATAPAKPWSPPEFKARQKQRDAMVRTIRHYGMTDRAVQKVMAAVPRHEFVPGKLSSRAYANSPLPIGYGQTISQPYIVAEMTRLLKLTRDSRVLEIGTGSGYQAAVLAHLTPHVYTIEIVKPLAVAAAKRLRRLGYDVVKVRHGDGYHGWAGEKHFDAIIVTCAAGQIPPPLIRQLAPGGRMVIPVGSPHSIQWLVLITKDKDGTVRSRSLSQVRFVPLLRKDVSDK